MSRPRPQRGFAVPLLLAVASACASCGDDDRARPVLPGEDIVLAKVNDTTITLYEVGAAAERTLGERAASLDKAGRRKVLESLVQSRAVAQLAQRELSEEERARLEKRVEAYREELLVLAYLERHIQPSPVTGQMVRDYYSKHPERFGGVRVVGYEMLASGGTPAGKQRETLIQALREHERQKDWTAFGEALRKAGHDVLYRRGNVSEQTLDPQLRSAMEALAVGQASSLIMLGGRLYVVRIVDARIDGVRPLEEVADDIRRTLSPVRVKEAVKGASKQALKKVEVVYQNQERLAGG